MGYSSRYHAASLAAIFFALGIGILIGAALGSDIVSGTADNLERDLGEDLDRLRAENGDLEADLQAEREFQELIVPAVTAGRLPRQEVALIALGVTDTQQITADLKAALTPAGAELVEVANVGEPPKTDELIDLLGRGPGAGANRAEALRLASERAGGLLVGRGSGLADALGVLVTGFKGEAKSIDAAVVVRDSPDDLTPREASDTKRLEAGLIEGMRDAGVRVVGAERSDVSESSIEALEGLGLTTVDNIEQLPGRVALVLALDGSEGSFGVKETADSLLPDLIEQGGPRPPAGVER
ncbi:MAG: copper transporter [Actinomycetota bacterium]|nr:copper transporter [Actinomycetota bacterium]